MRSIQLGISAIALLIISACGTSKIDTTIEAKSFAEKIDKSDYTLLDVRSPEEFATNHLANASNMNVNGPDFEQKAALLDKGKDVLVYCKSGARSAKAAGILSKMGFTVYDLKGGILEWQSKGYDVIVAAPKSSSQYTLASYNEATKAGKVVLVDFYATWCGPCKMMAPHIDAMKANYGDKLVVLKVDTDKSIEVSQHFKINAIPLVKLYKDGKEVYDKTGYHSAEDLKALLSKHI